METYLKLIVIGMMPMISGRDDEKPVPYQKIYVIEDDYCYIGYARGVINESRIQCPPH